MRLANLPYYAVEVWTGGHSTHPRRNGNAQVLRAEGSVVPGLYSSGEMGSILGMYIRLLVGVAECIAFGQIAGENAASESRLCQGAMIWLEEKPSDTGLPEPQQGGRGSISREIECCSRRGVLLSHYEERLHKSAVKQVNRQRCKGQRQPNFRHLQHFKAGTEGRISINV